MKKIISVETEIINAAILNGFHKSTCVLWVNIKTVNVKNVVEYILTNDGSYLSFENNIIAVLTK
jgi:hypothetical protein